MERMTARISFPRQIVIGVTSLGLDHVKSLGGTLPEIAWHKRCYLQGASTDEGNNRVFTLVLAGNASIYGGGVTRRYLVCSPWQGDRAKSEQ